MKTTGITRKIDELGRIVIPSELRKNLKINDGDYLEISLDEDKIILNKYKKNMECLLTGIVDDSNLSLLGGNLILSHSAARSLINQIEMELKK